MMPVQPLWTLSPKEMKNMLCGKDEDHIDWDEQQLLGHLHPNGIHSKGIPDTATLRRRTLLSLTLNSNQGSILSAGPPLLPVQYVCAPCIYIFTSYLVQNFAFFQLFRSGTRALYDDPEPPTIRVRKKIFLLFDACHCRRVLGLDMNMVAKRYSSENAVVTRQNGYSYAVATR